MRNLFNSGKFKVSGKKPVIVLLLIFLVFAVGYFYFRNKGEKTEYSLTEAQELVAEVSEYMLLPTENPTIATVTEKDKLLGQSFFKQAENGDKVLIFFEAGKAVLYRPSTKKIIDTTKISKEVDQEAVTEQANAQNPVATPTPTPVPTASEEPSFSPTPEPTPWSSSEPLEGSLTLTILNGTTISGLAKTVEDNILGKSGDYTVVATGNAARNDYIRTVVIDISGNNSDKAQALADLTSGKIISAPPEGQESPDSDLLIIAGTDSEE